MGPPERLRGRLAVFDDFVQQTPIDGAPSSQTTQVFLCFDQENLYLVWILHDSNSKEIRARMTRRDDITPSGDDFVEVTLDTFRDQRRGVVFTSNPHGIQLDGLWTEGTTSGRGPGQTARGINRLSNLGSAAMDRSFDTLWFSRGQLTPNGYVVWMAIPFKSLRFPASSTQEWGLTLQRSIPRDNELSFWPHVSNRIAGRLNQAGTIRLGESVEAGRNAQIIPFGIFRSFRALDRRDSENPSFQTNKVDPDAGLDAKFVFKDSLVLDVAANPDFSQVESDEPQVTANERFEVFFPEKRPFFLENSNFFSTPLNLVFTRRIVDPKLGARLSGKSGPWAIGGLVMDDESPGRSVADTDSLSGSSALFGIARVSRDIGAESSVGFIFTNRQYEGSFNRVGGVDGRWKLNPNWDASFQAVTSATEDLEQNRSAGPAYAAEIQRSGRHFTNRFEYLDVGRGFETETGFIRRNDIRSASDRISYIFRPETALILWEAILFQEVVWDHDGTRLDFEFSPRITFEMTGQTRFGFAFREERERLRPEDFPLLTTNQDFGRRSYTPSFSSNYFPSFGVNWRFQWGESINFDPLPGLAPMPAKSLRNEFLLTLRPMTELRIDNSYLYTRLGDVPDGESIFNNHILRSRLNWQFTKEMSFRTIIQYESVLANTALTDLETAKNLDLDFLFTYLVNPWTVLYVGYNSGFQNLDLIEMENQNRLLRSQDDFLNDARQFFVKFSYLFRF